MENAIQELQDFTQQVRRDILRMVHAVNSGHPGGSLGCAEFFTVLYQEVLEYSTEFSMDGKNEDVLGFDIKFDAAFYQAIQMDMGQLNASAVVNDREKTTITPQTPATGKPTDGNVIPERIITYTTKFSDIWDAVKLTINLELNNNCLREIKF